MHVRKKNMCENKICLDGKYLNFIDGSYFFKGYVKKTISAGHLIRNISFNFKFVFLSLNCYQVSLGHLYVDQNSTPD